MNDLGIRWAYTLVMYVCMFCIRCMYVRCLGGVFCVLGVCLGWVARFVYIACSVLNDTLDLFQSLIIIIIICGLNPSFVHVPPELPRQIRRFQLVLSTTPPPKKKTKPSQQSRIPEGVLAPHDDLLATPLIKRQNKSHFGLLDDLAASCPQVHESEEFAMMMRFRVKLPTRHTGIPS